MILRRGKRIGFEIKYSDAPRGTPSMKIAINELKLDRLTVLYPGESSYRLTDQIEVVSARQFFSDKKGRLG